MQAPSHRVRQIHAESTHVLPDGHATPQLLQLSGSVVTSTQDPPHIRRGERHGPASAAVPVSTSLDASGGPPSSGSPASIPPSARRILRHAWSTSHISGSTQSASRRHSTQRMLAGSHTKPMAEQSRSDVHGAAGVTQTPSSHSSPASQSAAVLHSAHRPRDSLQTRPGHIREDVHTTDARHAPSMQVLAGAQSRARVHERPASSGNESEHPESDESPLISKLMTTTHLPNWAVFMAPYWPWGEEGATHAGSGAAEKGHASKRGRRSEQTEFSRWPCSGAALLEVHALATLDDLGRDDANGQRGRIELFELPKRESSESSIRHLPHLTSSCCRCPRGAWLQGPVPAGPRPPRVPPS